MGVDNLHGMVVDNLHEMVVDNLHGMVVDNLHGMVVDNLHEMVVDNLHEMGLESVAVFFFPVVLAFPTKLLFRVLDFFPFLDDDFLSFFHNLSF
ncbi:hypothetical protein [Bacillus sp. MUM 116]|uniref:hypothetical protein n=1 Tax=Bacillus sp. MUM 116 TaxID=1678002 RepID=UPI0008F5C10B|nr:hypothetical protein [Bacillus sp. MUM 116]